MRICCALSTCLIASSWLSFGQSLVRIQSNASPSLGMSYGSSGCGFGSFAASTAITYVRVQTHSQTLKDGTQLRDRVETHCMQDGKGRVRIEISKDWKGSLQLQSITIFDPVDRESIVLYPRSRVAELTRFADLPRPPDRLNNAEFREAIKADYTTQEKSGVRLETEKLEPKTILGERVEGTRQTMITPVGELGNDKELRSISEQWTSLRLHLQLLRTSDDPVGGLVKDEVTEFHLEAPEPALFIIPSEYRVFDRSVDAPARK